MMLLLLLMMMVMMMIMIVVVVQKWGFIFLSVIPSTESQPNLSLHWNWAPELCYSILRALSRCLCIIHRLRSSCACENSHPGLCSPLVHSIVTNDCFKGPDYALLQQMTFYYHYSYFQKKKKKYEKTRLGISFESSATWNVKPNFLWKKKKKKIKK